MVGFRYQILGHPWIPDGTPVRFTFASWLRLRFWNPRDGPIELVLPSGRMVRVASRFLSKG